MAAHREIARVGQRIVLAENAIHVPHVGVFDGGLRQRQIDQTKGIEALPVLPKQHIADKAMQRRFAMGDVLPSKREHGFGQAAEAQECLIDFRALRIHDGGAIGHAIFAAVVIKFLPNHMHVLKLNIGAKRMERSAVISQRRAQRRGIGVLDCRRAIVNEFEAITQENIQRSTGQRIDQAIVRRGRGNYGEQRQRR